MSSTTTSRRDEADRIFGCVLPLIDSVLLRQYGLGHPVAEEVEESLHEWFLAFIRRPGSPQTLDRLRPHLLAMACNAGHVYWSAKPVEEIPRDDNLQRSLMLGPERIAIELEKTLEDLKKKRGGKPEKGQGP